MRVGRLVFGVQKVQAGFQLFDLLLFDGPLVNDVPEKDNNDEIIAIESYDKCNFLYFTLTKKVFK